MTAQILSWKVGFFNFPYDMFSKTKQNNWFESHCVFLLPVLSFSCPERINLTIQWYLRYYPCHNEFGNIEVSVREFSCDEVFQMLNGWWFFAGNVWANVSDSRRELGAKPVRAGRVHRTQARANNMLQWNTPFSHAQSRFMTVSSPARQWRYWSITTLWYCVCRRPRDARILSPQADYLWD